MAYFMVDGGLYAFVYSVVIGFLLFILNMIPVRELFKDVKKNWYFYVLTIAAFLLVSSSKLIPTLGNIEIRERIDQYHMSLKQIAISLFYPKQTIMYLDFWSRGLEVPGAERFHEYGCYIGVLSLIIIIWFIRKSGFWKKNFKEIIITLFFLWLATGFGGDFNPATILKKIPFINKTHVESRYFVVFMLFYVLILARVLSTNVKSRFVLIVILALLNVEYLLIKNYPAYNAFQLYYNKIEYPNYITKRKIRRTLQYVDKPAIYIRRGIASKNCYEAIAPWTYVQHVDEKDYLGEVYPLDTTGEIKVLEFSPGYIRARYDLKRPGTIVFNTNSHNSWKTDEPNKVIESDKNLLTVSVAEKKGEMKIHYRPPYLIKIIVLYILGIALFIFLFWRLYLKRKDTRQ